MTLAYPFPIQSSTRSFGASTFYGQQQDEIPVGVLAQLDHMVVQHAAGATFGVDVGAGVAYIPFGTSAGQGTQAGGLRRVYNDGVNYSGTTGSVGTDWTGSFVTADATNPRIDSVYLVVQDSNLDATGRLRGVYQIVNGTPTGGATLDNRTGAAAAPSNGLLLADVLISATQTTVTTAKIRDRRQFGPLINPPIFPTSGGNPAGVDQVTFEPAPGLQISSGALLGATNAQAAAVMYLPRRIVNATKIRWTYHNTAGPQTGSWNIGIADSSGRIIVSTGATATTGAASITLSISANITTTTFEAGLYWVFFGHTFTASPTTICVSYNASTTGCIVGPNSLAYANAGGTTVPTTILGLTDAFATPTGNQFGVPIIALSVG